jgi:hypothetical protein
MVGVVAGNTGKLLSANPQVGALFLFLFANVGGPYEPHC